MCALLYPASGATRCPWRGRDQGSKPQDGQTGAIIAARPSGVNLRCGRLAVSRLGTCVAGQRQRDVPLLGAVAATLKRTRTHRQL